MLVRKRALLLIFLLVTGGAMLFHACSPYREFHRYHPPPVSSYGPLSLPAHHSNYKTVFILADNRGTEIFDLMAPFAILSGTGQLNVYIVASDSKPILLRKGLFILPHYTFHQLDSAQTIKPDAIVIPALSDSVDQIAAWIQTQQSEQTLFMSICEGSRVAAETGLFDGKRITTHAYNLSVNERQFPRMKWTKGVSVTQDGRFFSTAGVSSAVEGSLLLIDHLLNQQVMQKAMQQICYPSSAFRLVHVNDKITNTEKWLIARKILFGKNRHIGVLVRDGVNELDVAAVLDTYHRSFPASIQSFTLDQGPIVSEHGLVLLPTGDKLSADLDELHVPAANSVTSNVAGQISVVAVKNVIWYKTGKTYIIDRLLDQLTQQYGAKYARVVALLLDYNQGLTTTAPKQN
ncbi:DJ-1/PfpI family protein [Spirosoma arcticum]